MQAAQRSFVQLRPGQRLGIVVDVGLHKVRAERIAMSLRANFHANPPRFAAPLKAAGLVLSMYRTAVHDTCHQGTDPPPIAPLSRHFLSTRIPLIGRIVAVSTRHPVIVVLVAALLTAVAGTYAARSFHHDRQYRRTHFVQDRFAATRPRLPGGVPATRGPDDGRDRRQDARIGRSRRRTADRRLKVEAPAFQDRRAAARRPVLRPERTVAAAARRGSRDAEASRARSRYWRRLRPIRACEACW